MVGLELENATLLMANSFSSFIHVTVYNQMLTNRRCGKTNSEEICGIRGGIEDALVRRITEFDDGWSDLCKRKGNEK